MEATMPRLKEIKFDHMRYALLHVLSESTRIVAKIDNKRFIVDGTNEVATVQNLPKQQPKYKNFIEWIALHTDTEWLSMCKDDVGDLDLTPEMAMVVNLFGKTHKEAVEDLRKVIAKYNSTS
jgi:hypothetical protein